MVTGALNQETWLRLCQVLQRSDLCTDPRFVELKDRVANRIALNEILNDVFSKKPTAEWVRAFEAAGVVIAPVNTVADMLAHPQAEANELMVTVAHPKGHLELVGVPMTFANWDTKPRLPPPELGQHTDEILEAIGYSAEEIASLRASGAI